jgi:hypothetical protein
MTMRDGDDLLPGGLVSREAALRAEIERLRAILEAMQANAVKWSQIETENERLRATLTIVRDAYWTDGETAAECFADLRQLARTVLEQSASGEVK